MSFNSEFNTAVKPLLKKLAVKEAQLKTLIVASLKNPTKSPAYWNKLRREVNVLYTELGTIFSAWSRKEIPMVYRKSISALHAGIKAKKSILATPIKTASKMANSATPTAVLLSQTASDAYVAALSAGRANTIRFTRLTQQVILTETEINLALITGLGDTGDLRKAARVLTGDFWAKSLDKIGNERFIQAGRYTYKPSYYAEMVARTKFHEAQSIAAMTTAKNYGTDLVRVSDHNTKTEICIPYEGNTYSISGTSKVYPPLEDTPPYHPNCLHLLYPVFADEDGREYG